MNVLVNLLPDIILQQRHEARIRRLATFILFGWIGLLVLLWLVFFGWSQFKKAQLSRAQKSRDVLNAQVNSDEQIAFREEARQVQNGLLLLSNLFDNQKLPAQLVVSVAANMPSEVVLRDLLVDEDEDIRLTGFAPDYADVSSLVGAFINSEQLAEKIEGLGYFSNVTLLQAVESDSNERRVISFSMSADFNQYNSADDNQAPEDQ